MHNIHIAGTGIWFPEQKVTNEEIVNSYNSYVENFNKINKESIDKGSILPMEYSSAEFIEKASGIKSRYMIDKEGSLDINRMMPRVDNEHPDRLSIHAKAGIEAAKKAMEQAEVSSDQIDAVIVGTSHAPRNYPAIGIEIQNELGISGYAYDILVGCSSTTFAINNAFSDIASGLADTVLVINPEINTPHVNFTHRDKHFIFGDACAATVVQRDSTSKKAFKILDRKLHTQFSNNIRSNYGYLNRAAMDNKIDEELLFHQNAKGVFKDVCPLVASLITDQLKSNNIEPSDARFPNSDIGIGVIDGSKSSVPIIFDVISLIILPLAWCNQNFDISDGSMLFDLSWSVINDATNGQTSLKTPLPF